MRFFSLRAVMGNALGLGLLAAAGTASGSQIIDFPSSFIRDILTALSTRISSPTPVGYMITFFSLPSVGVGAVPGSEAFSFLPASGNIYYGGSFVPCVVDSVSTDYCWPTDNAAGPVVVAANNAPIPEPSGIAVLAIAVAAVAFAVARWRSRQDAAPR